VRCEADLTSVAATGGEGNEKVVMAMLLAVDVCFGRGGGGGVCVHVVV
jgi:hypothetical protein